ncbi:MAG: PCMD domain-containing protein, partial [Muribaculaceae bacterium]|nr:PCMD domain-containing protein [Muribaculaceae bacterium]
GIDFIYTYYPDQDNSSMKINFEPVMTNAMPDGNYEFTVTATDVNGKTSTGILKLEINGTPVRVEPLAEGAAWATTATLTGTVRQAGATNVMFNHRERGTQAWTQVAPSTSESRSMFYTAEVSGRNPETDYEYTISCTLPDGSEYMSDDIQRFTTASAPQLPNAGFEEWDTESQKYYLIHAKGGEMFWDCGNKGSSTMSKNVTLPDGDVKHSGQYSAKLASQFVGVGVLGKFAAGNLFIGKYLKTDGTNGILGWGRPFTARPVALNGYVKYSPVAITHEKTDQGYKKGDMDTGIIYIALLDDSNVQTDPSWPDFPVTVKTANPPHLFDKNASNVIAYGEKVFNATSGEAMVEFTVPIKYNRTDVIPTNN